MRAAVVLCLAAVLSTSIAKRVATSGETSPDNPESGEEKKAGAVVKEKVAEFREKATKFGEGVKGKATDLAADVGGAVKKGADIVKEWAREKELGEKAAKFGGAVKERVDNAKEWVREKTGAKLLQEGGDPIANLIIAKKISRDAVNAVEGAKKRLDDVHSRYLKAAAKSAGLVWGTLKIPTGTNIEAVDYADLAEKYKARAADLLDEDLQLTAWSSTAAEMNAVEKKALFLLRLGWDTSSNATVEEVEEEEDEDEEEEADDEEDSTEELPFRKRLFAGIKAFPKAFAAEARSTVNAGKEAFAKAKSTGQAGKEAAAEAFKNAKAGKKILDDGGAEVKKVFVVKKCSLQAVDADTIAWKKVQAAHDKYVEAAEMLDAAFADPSLPSPLPPDVARLDEGLPDQYRAKAGIIKKAIDAHKTPPPSPAMSAAEMSAMRILTATGISCSF